jgi:hypothetical protein
MSSVFIQFVNDDAFETIELPSANINGATLIPYFKSMHGMLNRANNRYGSAELPIKFANVQIDEFMTILDFLQLKYHCKLPFSNNLITYKMLLECEWNDLPLHSSYLDLMKTIPIDLVVKCMCACSHMTLSKLGELFTFRVIHLLHAQSETIGSTMESLVKCASPFDLYKFQQMVSALIKSDSVVSCCIVKRFRSNSF